MKVPLRTSAQKAATGPTSREVYIDAILSDLSENYIQNEMNFIAMDAVPGHSVVMQSGRYGKFDRDDFWRTEAQPRQEGTTVPLKKLTISRDTYFCEQQAIGYPITDEARQNSESWLDLMTAGTRLVSNDLMIRREKDLLAIALPGSGNTSTWSTNITPTNLWDSGTSADPISDVRSACYQVLELTGFMPNRMIVGADTWRVLLDNEDLLARMNGGTTPQNPAMVNMERAAQLFELESIYVTKGVENTANDGADASYSFINDKGVLVYYAPMAVGLDTVSAITAFNWSLFEGAGRAGAAIRNYYDMRTMTEYVEGFMAYDYKVTGKDLGAYFAAPIS